MSKNDLIGKVYGRLTVRRIGEPSSSGRRQWICRCDCGIEVLVTGYNLTGGNTQSCGCLQRERSSRAEEKTIHGKTGTRVYRIWDGMIGRCYRDSHVAYANYGAAGITVCDRWKTFENFYTDMGDPPSDNHTLERRNGKLGYNKENCTWATYTEQANNRSNTIWIEHDARRQTVAQWSRELGISQHAIRGRLKRGLAVDQVLRS